TGEAKGIQRCDSMAELIDRRGGLANMHEPGRRHEIHIIATPRPAEELVPLLLLSFDEASWAFGTVTGEICLRITSEAVGKKPPILVDTVDCRIGKARQRHGSGIDVVVDAAPFLADRLSQRLGGDDERHTG